MIPIPDGAGPPENQSKYADQVAWMEIGCRYWCEDPDEGIAIARAWRRMTGGACSVTRCHDAAGGVILRPTDQPRRKRRRGRRLR